MRTADNEAWLDVQAPFPESVAEFRYLVRTQVRGGGEVQSGFVPWFATSKDEDSTHWLCVHYATVQKLDPADVDESHQSA